VKNINISHRTNWNFQNELRAYCVDDVKILAEICKIYHDENMEKRNSSPWFSSTAAGYCHKVILRQLSTDEYLKLPKDTPANDNARRERLNELSKTHWTVPANEEYWFARRALRGGRTEVRRIQVSLTPEEIEEGVRIDYKDVNGEYPFCQVNYDYPVGVPTVYVYDRAFYPCHNCRNPKNGNVMQIEEMNCHHDMATRLKVKNRKMNIIIIDDEPSAQEIIDDESFFGYVLVTINPPKNIYHGVLTIYDDVAEKSIIKLNRMTDVFTSVELKRAISKGYVLEKIHRFDKYNYGPGLWNTFIKKLQIDKISNGLKMVNGVVETQSVEQQELIVEEYERNFGMGEMVRESFPWTCNPVKKQIAKIMLNSGWGKHCQRPYMNKVSYVPHQKIQDQTELLQRYEQGYTDITSIRYTGAGVLYETRQTSNSDPFLHNYYLPAAAFVPAYGRLMLFDEMDKLGKNVIYCDTDSVIAKTYPNGYKIPSSECWGGWEEEGDSRKGIVSFTALAPKSYGYRMADGTESIKFKGLSLRSAHNEIMNLSVMEEMVRKSMRNQPMSVSVPQFGLRYNKNENKTFTSHSLKKAQFNSEILKGILHEGYVFPFGHCPKCIDEGSPQNHTC